MTFAETSGPALATAPALNAEMLELYRPVVDGLTKYSGVLCDGYAAMGTEWLTFFNRRMHADISLPARLAKCTSPQALFTEWASFMSTTAEDYRTEFGRLADIGTATSQRALSAARVNGA